MAHQPKPVVYYYTAGPYCGVVRSTRKKQADDFVRDMHGQIYNRGSLRPATDDEIRYVECNGGEVDDADDY